VTRLVLGIVISAFATGVLALEVVVAVELLPPQAASRRESRVATMSKNPGNFLVVIRAIA
jgi:Mg2+/Co2+ transporter CorB